MDKDWSLTIEVTDSQIFAETGKGGGNNRGTLDPGTNDTRRRLVNMFEKWLRDGKITERDQLELALLGTLLYEMIFPGDIGALFLSTLGKFQAELKTDPRPKQKRLRVELKIRQEDIALLAWEFLFCPASEGRNGFFLSERTDLVLSRYIPLPDERCELVVCPTIKVLVVEMQSGNPLVDVFKELSDAVEKDKSQGGNRRLAELEIQRSTNPTSEDLERQLRQFQPDVVHYIGPGNSKDSEKNRICLMELEDEGDQKDCKAVRWLSDREFGRIFQVHQPQLLFLHLWQAPETMRSSFAGLAPTLIGEKIKAVVALRYAFTPDVARKFTEKLYHSLLRCETVAAAVQEGRRALLIAGKHSSFGSPVLFMQSIDGPIAKLPAKPRTAAFSGPGRGLGTGQTALNAAGGAVQESAGAMDASRTTQSTSSTPEPVPNGSGTSPATRGATPGSGDTGSSKRKEADTAYGEGGPVGVNPLDVRVQQLQQTETETSGN
jgi:hypothetical protein